ncbi:MAG: bis(5'-nucleosyl)-tetraphosphatase (symmetrical) YqeK [Bacilli bacterium]|nr:bis(5'-nucleosyl)-tetraphosphatase (symmetrical) YqeK [Bacilli bacterium]
MNLTEFCEKYIVYKGDKPFINEKLESLIKEIIKDDRRVKHSLSVGSLSFQIAKENRLRNPIKFYVAGVLHDIAKGLSKEAESEMMKMYFPRYVSFPRYCYHQFLGGHIVKEVLKLDDKSICSAIMCHCTGKKNMNTIDKILYAADKIDPLRGYDSSYMIKAMKTDYDLGFMLVLEENYRYLEKKNLKDESSHNKLSDECFKYYLNF